MPAKSPRGSKAHHILSAAEALFAGAGYEGTSLNEIAERARVSKANVIHHYGCKEALYLAVVAESCRESADAVERIVAQDRPHTDKLRELASYLVNTMLADPERTRVVMREVIEHGSTRGHELARQVFRRNFKNELALFTSGQAAGAFRKDIDPVMGWMVLISSSLIYFLCRDVLRHHEEFDYGADPDKFARALCEVLERGIATAGEPPPAAPRARKRAAPRTSTRRTQGKHR